MKTINLSKPCRLPFEGAIRETQYVGEDGDLPVELKDDVLYIGGKVLGTYLCASQKEEPFPAAHDVRKELMEKGMTLPAIIGDFLEEHPEYYPESLKGKTLYFFEDTFGVLSNDRLCVRYVYWRDGRVISGSNGLGHYWNSNYLSGALTEYKR